MKIEEVVECLNKFIEKERFERKINDNSKLILLKTITPNPSFKVYKSFSYSLWYVKDKNKYNVFEINMSSRVVTGQEESVTKLVDKQVLYSIYELLRQSKFEEIIKGEYGNKI